MANTKSENAAPKPATEITYLPVDPHKAASVTETLAHSGVPYGWGHKVDPRLNLTDFLKFGHAHGVDCSGYIRWLMWYLSGGAVQLPDGSVNIGEELAAMASDGKVARVDYSECGNNDGFLRICGFARGGQNRHVFGIVNGLSIESHGHTTGVDRRPWTYPSLHDNVQWCYRVAAPVAVAGAKPPIKLVNGFDGDLIFKDEHGVVIGTIAEAVGLTTDSHAVIRAKLLTNVNGNIDIGYNKPDLTITRHSTAKPTHE